VLRTRRASGADRPAAAAPEREHSEAGR
jgi:hypothetical protein